MEKHPYIINAGPSFDDLEPVESAPTFETALKKARAIESASELENTPPMVTEVVYMPEDDVDTNDVLYRTTTTDDILVAIASWFADHPQAASDCRHYVKSCDYVWLTEENLNGIFGEEYDESYFDDIESDEDDIIYPEDESVGERIITVFDDDYIIQEGDMYYIDKQRFTRIGLSPNVGNYFKILIVKPDEGLHIFRIINTDQNWAMCVKTSWPTKCDSGMLNNLQNMNK